MSRRPLIDTGVLLALLDSRDVHHGWSRKVAEQHPQGFETCEAVVSELFYHVRASERAKHAILAMIESDWLGIQPVLPRYRVAVAHGIEKYHPRADYADACLLALHEQTGLPVWTVDRQDFTIYRTRAGKEVAAHFPG